MNQNFFNRKLLNHSADVDYIISLLRYVYLIFFSTGKEERYQQCSR